MQRWISHLTAVVWLPATVALMRFGLRWRIEGMTEARRYYRELRACPHRPLLICPNHLTMVDSALVAWALGSPWWYLRHFSALPWNTPERRNFATSLVARVLIYLMKCVPIMRGTNLRAAAAVLNRVAHLLGQGDAALLFPEGGRSRTGRVDVDGAAHGVGRLVSTVPGCRVLCVYLRGQHQASFSRLPARGECFRVQLACIEVTSQSGGLRRSVDFSRQIVAKLAELEDEAWCDGDDRQRCSGPRGS